MYKTARISLYALVCISLSVIIVQCGGAPVVRESAQQAAVTSFVDGQGNPTPTLLQLLALVPPQGLDLTTQPTLKQIVDATQKEWLRNPKAQRWHVEEKITANREPIMKIFNDAQFFTATKPLHKQYAHALLLGSTVPNMRKRLAYLMELWNNGLRFDNIIFLGGERPLDPEKEPVTVLYDRNNTDLPVRADWQQPATTPATETDGLRLIYDQADLPAEFKAVPTLFIDAPMIQKADGSLTRPTTGDTINLWLEHNPTPGSCLFISHQPYVMYQNSVVHTSMSKTFTVETVGNTGTEDNITLLLDTVARILYQENIRLNKQK